MDAFLSETLVPFKKLLNRPLFSLFLETSGGKNKCQSQKQQQQLKKLLSVFAVAQAQHTDKCVRVGLCMHACMHEWDYVYVILCAFRVHRNLPFCLHSLGLFVYQRGV